MWYPSIVKSLVYWKQKNSKLKTVDRCQNRLNYGCFPFSYTLRQSKNNQRRDKIYDEAVSVRDRMFRVFAVILTKIGVKPDYITIVGILLMLVFIYFVKHDTQTAALILFLALFCDWIDGVVARYQKTANDRGKFVDLSVDTFNSFLFTIGLVFGGLTEAIYVAPYLFFSAFSKAFRVYYHSFLYQSNWHFRAVAGFIPALFVYLGYAFYLLFLLGAPPMIFNTLFIIGSAVMGIDMLFFFFRIIYKK